MKAQNAMLNIALWNTTNIPLYNHYIKNTSHKVYRRLIALGYKPLGGNFLYNLGAKHYYINVIGEILYEGFSKNMTEVKLSKKNKFKYILEK